jgi:uncharacterized protein YdaU (DUF1376 family)
VREPPSFRSRSLAVTLSVSSVACPQRRGQRSLKNATPAFEYDATEFLRDRAGLSLAEVGLYDRLRAYCAIDGSIPDDARSIQRLASCDSLAQAKKLLLAIRHKFYQTEDGRLAHEIVDKLREKEMARKKSLSEKGHKGAEKRWPSYSPGNAPAISTGNGHANGFLSVSESLSGSISDPSSVRNVVERLRAVGFDESQAMECDEKDGALAVRWLEWLESPHPRLTYDGKPVKSLVAFALKGIRKGHEPPELQPPPVTPEQRERFGVEARRRVLARKPESQQWAPPDEIDREIRELVAGAQVAA